ncbi:RagB/SusD domain-containing protein [Filimonas lacunae]|uniref:RagB/SusD domain-containing protein n=1 Tax=Filimonas lacunae TaxID=477680 RepID=A0A173MKI9_9BACT|nr:RagB/SusD family nutrient uptake outer membrane protein [Filimonas lacunae]BAV07921.1 outer membrane protein, nutrient binding [Filimonas lacunae]SIT06547.1 RagB/SusD domain-containing protein [Filimonas lacunae]
MQLRASIIKGIAALLLPVTFTACSKSFVDVTPQGIIPVGSYYNTEIDIKNALNGTYNSLRTIYNEQYGYGELPSDNAQTFGESEVMYGEEDKLTWNATSVRLQAAWTRFYATIAYANIVLDHVGTPVMSDANRANYTAQAKFLRALTYFNLVRMYGAVPLVLKEIKTEAEAYTYLRTSADSVYAQIEKDLTEAAAVLPASYTGTDIGKATSIAAKALLGKVYMYEKKYPQAESTLAEVVATAGTLLSYDQIFGLGKDNNKEIIFSVQYLGGGYGEGNTFASGFVPQPSGSTIISVSGGSSNIGTKDLYDAFESGDSRLNTAIGIFTTGTFTYYYAKKFVYATVASGSEGDNDWPVLRYADAILLYAEALNENSKTPAALDQLNLIRVRSNLIAKTGLSQSDARDAIRKERRVELCFEAERWFDLNRWGIMQTVMTAHKANYPAANGTIGNIVSTLNLYPIPQQERTLNPNLSQNLGYN